MTGLAGDMGLSSNSGLSGDDAQCAADGSCITCSDAAVAVTVVTLLDDDLALVDTGSGREEVSVGLVSAAVGDTILVHAREAIAVVPR
jgi:hydrogenase expression/formation protein HypC